MENSAQKFCKFDLYTDKMVGLGEIGGCHQESILSNDMDEDYETEQSILDQSKIECKKDLLYAYNRITKS